MAVLRIAVCAVPQQPLMFTGTVNAVMEEIRMAFAVDDVSN